MLSNKTAQTQYLLVKIVPDNFDIYKIDINSSYETVILPQYINNLKANMALLNTDVYDLENDHLPDNDLDIRGKISNEPEVVIVCVDVHDCASFFGFIKKY